MCVHMVNAVGYVAVISTHLLRSSRTIAGVVRMAHLPYLMLDTRCSNSETSGWMISLNVRSPSEAGYFVLRVGNLTEENMNLSTFEFPTGIRIPELC